VGSDIHSSYGWLTGTSAGGGWYRHVKGQVEANLMALQLPRLSIFRPAAIIGDSHTGSFGSWLFPKFDWMLPNIYQSVGVDELGKAMALQALDSWESDQKQQQGLGQQNASAEPTVYIGEGDSIFRWVR
jgi:hypothetical protein